MQDRQAFRERRPIGAFGTILPLLTGLAGCSTAPSQSILGSYFPSWMLCIFAGIGATIIVRQLLGIAGLDKTLPAPLLVYLAFVVAFSFATWLIWLA